LTLVGVGALVVTAERLWYAAAQPLWLDESWTVAIISPPDWRGFAHEVYLDVNAPGYYLVMRLWSGLFGLSDLALRLPALIGVALAGAVAITLRVEGLSREARLTWGALLFFWWGVGNFLDARCYGLLLAVCTLQCVAFGRMMLAPSVRNAAFWAAVTALAILFQYYAILIGAVQGLCFLAAHRQRALKAWPAALCFAPVAAWLWVHAPRLAQYARPDVAWHPRVDAPLAAAFSGFTVGAYSAALAAAAILIVAFASLVPRAPGRDQGQPIAPHLAWLAGAGALALAMTLLSGVIRPSLAARYLIPVVPSMLLALVLMARRTTVANAAFSALALVYLAFAANPYSLLAKVKAGSPYGADQASQVLMDHAVSQVVFIWDHPAVRIMDPGSLRRLGAVTFRRQRDPARITPLIVKAGDDPNRLAIAAATGPRPGVIWIYDRTSNTAARTAPPRLPLIDPRWACRTFGDGRIGSVACYPSGSGAATAAPDSAAARRRDT
jgi:hypothetical protein